MSESWDSHADGWDTDPDVVEYSKCAYASLSGLIELKGLAVLDFGCGTGLLTGLVAAEASRVVGLDPSAPMIDVLRAKSIAGIDALAAELTPALIESHPSFREPFDLVLASSVCAFVPNYGDVVRMISSLLKPGGSFIQWDWKRAEGSDFGFSAEMMSSAFEGAGFGSHSIHEPFSLSTSHGTMTVLMGVAVKA